MNAYSLSIWFGCLALESIVAIRALRTEWFRSYRIFFTYIIWVLFQDLVFLAIYFMGRKYYAPFYWAAEFATVALGCGVTWEVFQRALKCCPGAARMAKRVLALVLVAVVSKITVDFWNDVAPWPGTMIELERNLRTLQATSLIALGLLIAYYGIPLGRNLMGVLFGYGLFISSSVLNLTLRAFFGHTFQTTWIYLQPLCYSAVLAIWCITLWTFVEAPISPVQTQLEKDYAQLAKMTKRGFLQVRAYLGWGLRP